MKIKQRKRKTRRKEKILQMKVQTKILVFMKKSYLRKKHLIKNLS